LAPFPTFPTARVPAAGRAAAGEAAVKAIKAAKRIVINTRIRRIYVFKMYASQ
jgi:hypothetical protein